MALYENENGTKTLNISADEQCLRFPVRGQSNKRDQVYRARQSQ